MIRMREIPRSETATISGGWILVAIGVAAALLTLGKYAGYAAEGFASGPYRF